MKSKVSYRDYLSSLFGDCFSIEENEIRFPLFLRNSFSFSFTDVNGKKLVFAETKEDLELSLVSYRKSKEMIEKNAGCPCVLVTYHLGTHLKEGMIRNGFMFVVPGKEVYLPEYGIILHKETKKCREELTPSSQLAAIYLFFHSSERFAGSFLQKNLGMNAMMVSRAMRQLVQLGFFKAEKENKTIIYSFVLPQKEYLDLLLEHGINPVRDVVTVDEPIPGSVISGESALSHYTQLAEPIHPVRAVRGLKPKESYNTSSFSFCEIYKYNPGLLSSAEYADPVSVLLSFKGKKTDERTEAEMERLKEEITSENHQWSSELH